MSDWEYDPDDLIEALQNAQEEHDLEASAEDVEAFVELVEEIGDFVDDAEGFSGRTAVFTVYLDSGEDHSVVVPTDYLPDIIDLAYSLGVEYEIDSP